MKIPLLSTLTVCFALVLLSGVSSAFACSCRWQGPFVEMAKKSPLIVAGRVKAHSPEAPIPLSLELEIETVLRGKEERKLIRIYGDNGMLCRPYVGTFPVGTRWVMALGRAEEEGGAYAISICGEYSLPLTDGKAMGSITARAGDESSRESIELEALRALVTE